MRKVLVKCVQGISLSRIAINGVLKCFGLNGYRREERVWKFFRAKCPDELWQLDIKGPVWIGGRKFWFPVCVDDYSRYLLVFECFNHEPTTDDLTRLLEKLGEYQQRYNRVRLHLGINARPAELYPALL